MTVRTQFPFEVRELENVWIEMRDGTRLAARIWLPDGAEADPVPAILEYIPYRKRDATAARDALNHPYFAGHGYAAVRLDMRGCGDSQGVLHDEYLKQEQDDALDAIAWLAARDWCSGAVGMIGISWGGFNGLQVAAHAPEALKAVITVCSTDDRYADDIHYKGGCLLGENLGWASTMFAYSSRPPDPLLVGDAWRDIWMARLEEEPLLVANWLRHQHRDAYWRHGSVCEDFGAIAAATLCVGGWGDAYSNAIPRLMRGLRAPARAIIGPWVHKYPNCAVPEPRIGFLQEALRWWDRWLKGTETAVERDPNHRYYLMDGVRPASNHAERKGRWLQSATWPPQEARDELWRLGRGTLSKETGAEAEFSISSPQWTGLQCGEFCSMWPGPETPGDQRSDDAGSLVFDTEPLPADLAIAGAPVVRLRLRIDRPRGLVAARLCDVWPDGAATRITFGVLNLCHASGHDAPRACVPGETIDVDLRLDDIAYKVAAGNRLRLAISNAYWPMIWPSAEAVMMHVDAAGSHLVLQSLGGEPEEAPEFAEVETAAPLERETLRAPSNERVSSQDQASGETTLRIIDDFGEYRITAHGLASGEIARETYRIGPDDPLSASAETHWTETLSRGDWSVRTETWTRMWADATHFHLEARLEAFEGETCVVSRTWSEKIGRDLV